VPGNPGGRRARQRGLLAVDSTGSRRDETIFRTQRSRPETKTRPFGNHPLIGLGVDGLRWMAPVRPGDVLHIEGEVISLTPSRTKPQGIALVKWTVYNQRSEAVYTFTPIAIVPRRPDPDS
jgi:acyl dehydratase